MQCKIPWAVSIVLTGMLDKISCLICIVCLSFAGRESITIYRFSLA